MITFSLLALLSFAAVPQPEPAAAFCDELRQILAGIPDNFNALKEDNIPGQTNFWNATLTLSNTQTNYIYTQYGEKGQPLSNTYYAIISDEKAPALQNAAIEKIAGLIDGCGLRGYTKTVKSTGISQFSDDPALEKNAPKKITWTHTRNRSTLTLMAYYDAPAQKDQVALMVKAPYKFLAIPTVSRQSTTASWFSITNSSRQAIDGYWLDFTGMEVYYFTLQPGQQTLMDSYTGHVWRFKSTKTKAVVASTEVKGISEVFVVR